MLTINEATEKLTEIKNFLEQREAKFEDFEKRMRENIKSVSSEEYGNLVNDTYAKFEEEHKTTDEIFDLISETNNKILKSDPNNLTEQLEKQNRILSNGIDEVMRCQRRIIVKSENVKHEYVQKLEDEIKQPPKRKKENFSERMNKMNDWSDKTSQIIEKLEIEQGRNEQYDR